MIYAPVRVSDSDGANEEDGENAFLTLALVPSSRLLRHLRDALFNACEYSVCLRAARDIYNLSRMSSLYNREKDLQCYIKHARLKCFGIIWACVTKDVYKYIEIGLFDQLPFCLVYAGIKMYV